MSKVKNEAPVAESAANQLAPLPDGFEEAAPKKMWVPMAAGVRVQGVLLESETRKQLGDDGNKQHIMSIEITQPHGLIAVKGSLATEDREEIPVQVGDIVWLDVKARLSSLMELCDEEDVYEVWIACGGKAPIFEKNDKRVK